MNIASHFLPHGHCFLWDPFILIPTVLADILTFISYTLIPFAFILVAKKRKDFNPYAKRVLLLFALFIFGCGFTHLVMAYNYWHAAYHLEMFLKVFTAIISIITAIMTFKLIPSIVQIPKVQDHLKLIEELQKTNERLEDKVEQRTQELKSRNELLENLISGIEGQLLEYIPIFSDENKIVDFKVRAITAEAYKEAGLKSNEEFNFESLRKKFPTALENGHFDSAIKAYETNAKVMNEATYTADLNKYFNVTFNKFKSESKVFVYFMDVTQKVFQEMNFMANSKLISLGEMASNIAHEINSPLQIIDGKLRHLQRATEQEHFSAHEKVQIIKGIKDTLSRIKSITQNLSRLSFQSDSNLEENEFQLKNFINQIE